MKTNGKSKALIRLLVMAVLTVNAGLTLAGKNPIPFDETTFTEIATQIAAGLSVVWSWWKNNNVTDAACETQGLLDIEKGKTISNLEEEDIYDDEDDLDDEEEE